MRVVEAQLLGAGAEADQGIERGQGPGGGCVEADLHGCSLVRSGECGADFEAALEGRASPACARRSRPCASSARRRRALDMQDAVDALDLVLALEMDVGMDRRDRPLLALGIHAQGDHGAGAERRGQQVVGRGAGILAAQLGAFVGRQLGDGRS